MPDVRVVIVEEPGLDLLDLLEGIDAVILVDAVCSGAKAGRIHRFDVDTLSDLRHDPAGAHSRSIAALLRLDGVLNPQSGQQPVKLLGIEAAAFAIGTGLSEAVRVALSAASDAIEQAILSLLHAEDLARHSRRDPESGGVFVVWYISGALAEAWMEINYRETAKDLLVRINIHEKYGARSIDEWTAEVLQPKPGMKILDVGCGAGKQCFLYSDVTNRQASIIGGDFSAELLERARTRNAERGDAVEFQLLDFNKRWDFAEGAFDLVSSAFAIYYSADLEFTFGEAHRVLRPGGRLFVTGPLPENKRLFYEIIQEASKRPIPPMPGSSRFRTEIYGAIDGLFATTQLLTFENPITFPDVAPFMDYVQASLSEDRKLWTSMFADAGEYAALIEAIRGVAARWFSRDGKLVMTKVVGGILATK
ncbi:MAG: hydrogenase maturation protease [Chloroflexota bacterium]